MNGVDSHSRCPNSFGPLQASIERPARTFILDIELRPAEKQTSNSQKLPWNFWSFLSS